MSISTVETVSVTVQSVDVETKEGKQFLRRVIRENSRGSWGDGWTGHASPESDWRLELRKTIKGEIGEPEQLVIVRTDVELKPRGKYGEQHEYGDTAEPTVDIPSVRRAYLACSDMTLAASMLIDGWRLQIDCHRGSQSSKAHGLGFTELTAYRILKVGREQYPSANVVISSNVSVNGRTVCGGTFN